MDSRNTTEKIYDFMCEYLTTYLFPPSIREIGEAVGISSTSTIWAQLQKLENKGLIERIQEKGPRAITIKGYKIEKIK